MLFGLIVALSFTHVHLAAGDGGGGAVPAPAQEATARKLVGTSGLTTTLAMSPVFDQRMPIRGDPAARKMSFVSTSPRTVPLEFL